MSDQITQISGTAIPVPGNDIDTDQIVPARFLKEITFDNMGNYLFYDQRFNSDGSQKEHPVNTPYFRDSAIMITGKNFGCGSSREHAPQAIKRWGIKAIIGESFAEIFEGNCKSLGIPVIVLPKADINTLIFSISGKPDTKLNINLTTNELTVGNKTLKFEMDNSKRQAFLAGTWEASNVLAANDHLTKKTANNLPYISNFTA